MTCIMLSTDKDLSFLLQHSVHQEGSKLVETEFHETKKIKQRSLHGLASDHDVV